MCEECGNSWNALRRKLSWVMMMGETLKITTEEQRTERTLSRVKNTVVYFIYLYECHINV
ncbi:BnaC02g02420D [Brassica napus]|uniref:BnaC02g02420D protein n=1 Tax=Brassica napus TaxID=3708 RepID=A0A078FI72_BRANA|nr:BnaC02g02420D [Brassica napus]